MELLFKQDKIDDEMWHQYLVVNNNRFHSGTMHRDILDSILVELDLDITVSDITNPDTINCDTFSITIAEYSASINF